MRDTYFNGKQIFVTTHAIKRARERNIAFPDQVYATLVSGKIKRFGKNGLKFIKRSKKGAIICVGEEFSHAVIIKTVERA